MTTEEMLNGWISKEEQLLRRKESNEIIKADVMLKVIGKHCKKCWIKLDDDRYHGAARWTKCYDCFREMMNEPARKKKELSKSSPEEYIRHKSRIRAATAKQRKIVFDIDADYLVDRLRLQEGKCLYTSNELQVTNEDDFHTYLTLDRLDSRYWYVEWNVAFCSRFYNNRIKKDLSIEWFRLFAPKIYKTIVDIKNNIFNPCVFDTKSYEDELMEAKEIMEKQIYGRH